MTPQAHSEERADVLVVGGGIAGLSTAVFLARGGRRPLVLEQEPTLAAHASGRNAAIWLPGHDDATTPGLVRRSGQLLDAWLAPAAAGDSGGSGPDGAAEMEDAAAGLERPGDTAPPRGDGWLERSGGLYVAADPSQLDEPERGARRAGQPTRRLDAGEAVEIAPALAGGTAKTGLLLPEAGVLDVHAITQELSRRARRTGARIRTRCRIARIVERGGRVRCVELEGGARLTSECVVLAGGAWAAGLGATCGAPLPLVPLRRHLVHLDVSAGPAAGPLVWALGEESYFRPEAGGLLSSPCDEEPWRPEVPPVDPSALERLAEKLRSMAPALASSRVRRVWACLRTFAPDRELVAGADPRVEGLFWLAGLGGRGMSIGVAAGELAASLVLGRDHPLADTVHPARLL